MPFHHHNGRIPFFDALTPQALCCSFQDRVSVDAGQTPLGEMTDGLRVENKGCGETDSEARGRSMMPGAEIVCRLTTQPMRVRAAYTDDAFVVLLIS